MNVSLTPELEQFIEKEVQTGMYQSASEVIRAGLRLLKAEKGLKPRFMVSSMEELEESLLAGVRQLDRGEGIPGEAAAKELRNRAAARRTRNG
jgi:antitoxin ParD1/3/4